MNAQATAAPTTSAERAAAVRLSAEQIAAIAALVPMSPKGPQARVPISRVIDGVDRQIYQLAHKLEREVQGGYGNPHSTAADLQRMRQNVAILKWLRENGAP